MTPRAGDLTPRAAGLLASDADRERVIEVLRTAYADGRLGAVQLDERLEAALAARTLGALGPLTADLVALPAAPAAERLTVKERHGTVRRDGPWTLPHRLVLDTAWCTVTLDLTHAVLSGPELVVQCRVRGGDVQLVLVPGMTVDANGLSVRHGTLEIDGDTGEAAGETLRIRLVGRMRYGRIAARWQAQRP